MSDATNSIGGICAKWHARLHNKDLATSRRDLAQLRRAHDPLSIFAVTAVHDLNERLDASGRSLHRQPDKLALLASALAHVGENSPQRAARAMGAGDPKAVSPLRFDAIVQSASLPELATNLRRGLKLIGGQANVARLSEDLFFWGDKVKINWAFDYHGADLPLSTPQYNQTNLTQEAPS